MASAGRTTENKSVSNFPLALLLKTTSVLKNSKKVKTIKFLQLNYT